MIITEYVMYRGKKKKVSDLSPTCGYKVDVQCPICGEIREVCYRSVAKAGHCICQSCVMKERRKIIEEGTQFGRLFVIGKSSKSGYSVCRCECGNIGEFENYNLLSGKTRSCGCLRSEQFKNFGFHPEGKEHWNWQGGISTDRRLAMSKKEYKVWRKEVFERDKYVCQKCGKVGVDLRAHHIFNYANNPDMCFDVNNGITLCDKCHREFHHINGFSTNKEQLEEFLC